MNLTIPFSKEIIFKTKIAEITSISLERDISINDNELLGDFIISGEYKNLDINVDTYPFSHVVPFSVSLDEDIDINTLKYEVVDFRYEIVGDDTLKVYISLSVEADKLFKRVDEVFEKVEDIKDETLLDPNENLEVEVEVKEDENDERNNLDLNNEEVNILPIETENEISQDINYSDAQDDFITYHVHIVKIDETIDSICETYKITKEELFELNDVKEISMGDKLIIRESSEN